MLSPREPRLCAATAREGQVAAQGRLLWRIFVTTRVLPPSLRATILNRSVPRLRPLMRTSSVRAVRFLLIFSCAASIAWIWLAVAAGRR